MSISRPISNPTSKSINSQILNPIIRSISIPISSQVNTQVSWTVINPRSTLCGLILRHAAIILMFLFMNNVANAQFISGNSNFARQLDAVSWNFNSAVNYQKDNLDLSLFNTFNSRMFIFNERAQNVQDEHSARLQFGYDFTPYIGITGRARTFTFTNTSLRQDIAYAGLRFRPYDIVRIEPSIGIMSDERSNRRDQGLAYSLDVNFDILQIGETRVEPSFFTEIADINPRRYRSTQYGTRTLYQFEDVFEISTEFWIRNARRDSYQASSILNRDESNFIESIESDTLMANVSIRTPITQRIYANIDVFALNNIRKVLNYALEDDPNLQLYDSRSIRQNLDIITSFVYPTRTMRLNVGFAWMYQIRQSQLTNTEGFPEDQIRRRTEILENSNYNQRRFEVFSRNNFRITPRYDVDLFGSTSIMRYDTPEMNRDDRDELSFMVRTQHRYRYSDELTAYFTLAGEAYHYVYLFSERSIENNWRRSIRLIPEINWQPSDKFILRQRFLVRANYTVEDFEVAGRQKNDQSAREMAFITNTSWEFSDGWSLDTDASRSELRIGRLFWKTFQETPIDTLITYDIQTVITRRFGDIHVSSGIRYFRKIDFLQRATVQLELEDNGEIIRETRVSTGQQITEQWGPVVTIRLPLSARNELYINGWMQRQETWQKLYTTYPEELRQAFLRAERQTTRRMFPNLEITARFRF
jgi:hypothetical protein